MDAGDDTPQWRKSSYSSSGACVEVAPQRDVVLVRDTKNRQGTVLTFAKDDFRAFVAAITAGEFDDL
jgi:hypothetical protein